jgi:hypothetical protein
MADTALTSLAAAAAIDADDLLYVVEDGTSKKATVTQLAVVLASIITPGDIGAQPAGSVDADDVTYTPTTLADWDGSADPGDVEQALDQLAERVTDVEGASLADGDKGDIVVSSGGTVWSFDTGVVTAAAKTVLDDATTGDMRTTLSAAARSQTAEMISGYIGTVADKDYRIVVKAAHAGTATETTTRSESGTATFTFKINTTAFGGTANSVSSSEQSQAHASANAWSAGDDIVITASANAACVGASFTIAYTRVYS